jgi:hypothetical protein
MKAQTKQIIGITLAATLLAAVAIAQTAKEPSLRVFETKS